MKTKQHSQATTIENLKSETSWEFHALLIKQTECILTLNEGGSFRLRIGLPLALSEPEPTRPFGLSLSEPTN